MEQANLPATTTETDLRALSTSGSVLDGLAALPKRLSDADLAAVVKVAEYPLPALPACEESVLEEELRLLTVLPRRRADEVTGALMVSAYKDVLGEYPVQAIRFLRHHALRHCKFMPSTAECVEILEGWQRRDGQAKAKAEVLRRNEMQARMEDTMARLQREALDQAAIDALPENWKRIAETRGLLRITERDDDGNSLYVARPQPKLKPETQAEQAA